MSCTEKWAVAICSATGGHVDVGLPLLAACAVSAVGSSPLPQIMLRLTPQRENTCFLKMEGRCLPCPSLPRGMTTSGIDAGTSIEERFPALRATKHELRIALGRFRQGSGRAIFRITPNRLRLVREDARPDWRDWWPRFCRLIHATIPKRVLRTQPLKFLTPPHHSVRLAGQARSALNPRLFIYHHRWFLNHADMEFLIHRRCLDRLQA